MWKRMRLIGNCLVVLAAALWLGGLCAEPAAPAFARLERQTLVIDPGHGGEDGGAVSPSGQEESQVNLEIARSLDALMGFYGVSARMTRTEDVSIHDPSAKTLREKKRSDLKNRVALIQSVENATQISIHQNASPVASHRGIQVFYGTQAQSRPLAQQVQKLLTETLAPEKERKAQAAPSSVYLMAHVTCPAILVECGFLSNPEEECLLREPAYQRKLAMSLAAGYLGAGSTPQEGALI